MRTNKLEDIWNYNRYLWWTSKKSIHFQDSYSRWKLKEGEQIRGRQNCELGVSMQRNKLTRPLGFGEKAFHEQELKKKIVLQKWYSWIRIGKIQSTAYYHRSDISSRITGVKWVWGSLNKHLPRLAVCQHYCLAQKDKA